MHQPSYKTKIIGGKLIKIPVHDSSSNLTNAWGNTNPNTTYVQAQRNKLRAYDQTCCSVLSPQPYVKSQPSCTEYVPDSLSCDISQSLASTSRHNLLAALSSFRCLDPNDTGYLYKTEVVDVIGYHGIVLDRDVIQRLMERYMVATVYVGYKDMWRFLMDCFAHKTQPSIVKLPIRYSESRQSEQLPPALQSEVQFELRLYTRMQHETFNVAQLWNSLKRLDTFQTGQLLHKQVMMAFDEMRSGMNLNVIGDLMKWCDVQHKGLVNYKLFIDLLLQAQPTYLPPLGVNRGPHDASNNCLSPRISQSECSYLNYPTDNQSVYSSKQCLNNLEKIGKINLPLTKFETKIHTVKRSPNGQESSSDVEQKVLAKISTMRISPVGMQYRKKKGKNVVARKQWNCGGGGRSWWKSNVTPDDEKRKEWKHSNPIKSMKGKKKKKFVHENIKIPETSADSDSIAFYTTYQDTDLYTTTDVEFTIHQTKLQKLQNPCRNLLLRSTSPLCAKDMKVYENGQINWNRKDSLLLNEKSNKKIETKNSSVNRTNVSNGETLCNVKNILRNITEYKGDFLHGLNNETKSNADNLTFLNNTENDINTNKSYISIKDGDKKNNNSSCMIETPKIVEEDVLASSNKEFIWVDRQINNIENKTKVVLNKCIDNDECSLTDKDKRKPSLRDKHGIQSTFNCTTEQECNKFKEEVESSNEGVNCVGKETEALKVNINEKMYEFPVPESILYSDLHKQYHLQLDWIYGCGKQRLFTTSANNLIFSSGSVVVFMDTKQRKQSFFRKHVNDVTSFCVNGNDVASGEYIPNERKSAIYIWDSLHMLVRSTLYITDATLVQMAALKDGTKGDEIKFLATILRKENGNQVVRVYDTQSDNHIEIDDDKSNVSGITSSPNDYSFLTFGREKHLRFYKTGQSPKNWKSIAANYGDLCVSKNITTAIFASSGDIITGDSHGNIYFWSQEEFQIQHVVTSAHCGPITMLVWCSHRYLFSGSRTDVCIRIWDEQLNKCEEHRLPETAEGCSSSVIIDNQLYVATTTNAIMTIGLAYSNKLLHLITLQEDILLEGNTENIISVHGHSLYSEMCYTLSCDGGVSMYNTETRCKLWTHYIRGSASSLTIHPSEDWILIGCVNGSIHVLHSTTGDVMGKHRSLLSTVTCLQFNSDGSYLATGHVDGCLAIHSFEAGLLDTINSLNISMTTISAVDWCGNESMLRLQDISPAIFFYDMLKKEMMVNRQSLNWQSNNCIISYELSGLAKHGFCCVSSIVGNFLLFSSERLLCLTCYPYVHGNQCFVYTTPKSGGGKVEGLAISGKNAFVCYRQESSLWQWKIIPSD